MKTKSALPMFGSEAMVAPQLAAMLDHCKHVTIACVGGGPIIPHLKATHIVANDLNDLAMNFHHVTSGVYGLDAQSHLFTRAANLR